MKMEKIKYIEGLKGIAILVVLLHHYVLAFCPALHYGYQGMSHSVSNFDSWVAKTPLNLIYNGNFAVFVFFILSGYVLSYKFFKFKDHEYITASAIKRYFRLLFPVVFSVFVAYLLIKLGLFYNQKVSEYSKSFLWLYRQWQIEPSFFTMCKEGFYDVFFQSDSLYNSSLWIIRYEFLGSFLVLAFVSFWGNVKRRYFIYIIIVIVFFYSHFLVFILGVLLCDIKNNTSFFTHKKSSIWMVLSLISGLYLGSYPTGLMKSMLEESFFYHFFPKILTASNVVTHTWGAFFILMALLLSERAQSLLSRKVFTFFGDIAYSLFVIHVIILGSFSCWLFLILFGKLSYFMSCLVVFMISSILITVVSYMIFRTVDRFGIFLSKSVYRRLC